MRVSHGSITGTASQSALDDGAIVTASTPMTGELVGRRVALRLSALSAPWMFGEVTVPLLNGTLANGVLNLMLVHTDASVEAVIYHQASIDAYRSAVGEISAAAQVSQQLRRTAS